MHIRSSSLLGMAVLALCAACSGDVGGGTTPSDSDGSADGLLGDTDRGPTSGTTKNPAQGSAGAGSTGGGTAGSSASGGGDPDAPIVSRSSVRVALAPQAGVSGTQRVNFAVPLARGALTEHTQVRVLDGSDELASAKRALATHRDGSVRSVQVQVDVNVDSVRELTVEFGQTSEAPEITRVPVEDTLLVADGTTGPKVWARLPAAWLADSKVTGFQVPASDAAGDPWSTLCAYEENDVTSFLSQIATSSVWLYDRGTVNYRGYARRGDAKTLESAYRETAIYRAGLRGSGSSTEIGLADKVGDLKYYYSQNMAIHYLLTGDDRFREGAENVAAAIASLWASPGYAGGDDFWTERHAGFSLLAYVFAAMVSDDKAAEFNRLADEAVAAYEELQASFPSGYTDVAARCFAHEATAHGEDFGYVGCSPWMSAILADGLESYAIERDAAQADGARAAIVKLGRSIARDGRDSIGRPYYWMGVNNGQSEPDEYEEHWGESAYIVAMAWHYDGRRDAALRTAADELVEGFGAYGEAPHMRSANWQCRSAVATPFYLKP